MPGIPLQGRREAHETEGFGGGSAIEHDDIELLFCPVLIDVHHGAQFFHAWEDGHLFRFHIAQARSSEIFVNGLRVSRRTVE